MIIKLYFPLAEERNKWKMFSNTSGAWARGFAFWVTCSVLFVSCCFAVRHCRRILFCGGQWGYSSMVSGYFFKITHPLVKRSTLNSDLSSALKNTKRYTLAVITAVTRFSRRRLSKQRARRDFHSVQFKFCEEMFKMIDYPNNSLEFLFLQFKASQKLDVKEKEKHKKYMRMPILPIEQHRKSKNVEETVLDCKNLPRTCWGNVLKQKFCGSINCHHPL